MSKTIVFIKYSYNGNAFVKEVFQNSTFSLKISTLLIHHTHAHTPSPHSAEQRNRLPSVHRTWISAESRAAVQDSCQE